MVNPQNRCIGSQLNSCLTRRVAGVKRFRPLQTNTFSKGKPTGLTFILQLVSKEASHFRSHSKRDLFEWFRQNRVRPRVQEGRSKSQTFSPSTKSLGAISEYRAHRGSGRRPGTKLQVRTASGAANAASALQRSSPRSPGLFVWGGEYRKRMLFVELLEKNNMCEEPWMWANIF